MDNHPLSMLHNEILGCVDAGFYSLPIFMAAAIPDICAALEADNGRTTAKKYKAWFAAWVSERMSLISADDCYNLRCGLIHQGRLGNMDGGINQVVFLLPSPMFASFANNRHDQTYLYGIDSFCRDMIASSNAWWSANSDNQTIIKNTEHVLKLHPTGFGNSISGMPVLA